VLGEDEVLFRTIFADLFAKVVTFPRALTPREAELARRLLFELRFRFEGGNGARQGALVDSVERVLDAARGGRAPVALRGSGSAQTSRHFLSDLLRRFEVELRRGRVIVERRSVESLDDFEPPPRKLPPLPPPRREVGTHSFELRLVDEVGQAIGGIEADFSADGPKLVTSNAGGVALLSGVRASSASAALLDAVGLDEILDPRWQKPRPGKPPKEANLTEVVFRGGELGPFSLKAEVSNTVVIKPPLGKLFAELFDKTGRVRHAERRYTIAGPASFSGTTDAQGGLLHEQVFPGDYELTLTLEHFKGDVDEAVDTVATQLVVLAPEAGLPQKRQLGAVPRSVLAELHLFFNTNKSFLLPTALPSVHKLRELYLGNAPCQLLVVGHADTKGGAAYNDKLSLDRAKSVIAYLKDDVEAWYEFYGESVDLKNRWGKVEDRLMIIGMPDFTTKPKGEDVVRWYQRTRGLTVDGKAGTDTRHALIREYLSLDGASLSELAGEIVATAHGCGENFPLDETGEHFDAEPADDQRDRGDRRVELFFFDAEFEITPKPPGENSKPGSTEYPLWRRRVSEIVKLRAGEPAGPKVKFIELADALFRTNSAVVLPEGELPSKDGDKVESLSSVSAFALLLRLNEERPGKKLFIAGHTDTAGTEDSNQPLSQERAECALSILTGDRARFQDLCQARHKVADYKQILAWVSRAFSDFGFACDSGKIDDNAATAEPAVRRFQTTYNEKRGEMGIEQPSITVDGSVGKQTWGAFFDCYELALAQELGEDTAGVAALREQLVFVDDEHKALGFSEYFPVEELGVDHYRSQENRRVELLTFDPGEEPDLVHAKSDPETSELYLPGYYQRTPLPTRPGGAKPHLRLSLLLFRPDGTRSGVTYELFNEDKSFIQTISEPQASAEFDETLQLDFVDVPMGLPLTLRQKTAAGSIDFGVSLPPSTVLVSAPPAFFVKELAPKAEESLSFLSYDLDGALV
jgi:outer membrane protein OmpA-like peptidoglycan-associated protein